MKFEGLEAWRVGAIVTSVPLLLQLALALFLLGICELLWHLHQAVGIAVTTVAGLTGIFYLLTASAPLWQYLYLSISSRLQMTGQYYCDPILPGCAFTVPQCPYKSPQAWLALRICQPVIDWIVFHANVWLRNHRPDSWVSFDAYWTARRDEKAAETTTSRALLWTANVLGETHLNALRVLCARQHLAQAGGSVPYRSIHQDDIMEDLLPSLLEGVAGVYEQARLYKQVVLSSSSCRPDLDVNTSVELFLQFAARAPFDLKWFSSGLRRIWESFLLAQPTLNDGKQLSLTHVEMFIHSIQDLAIELLRVVQDKLSSEHTSLRNILDVSFMLQDIAVILGWALSRTLFLPAFCDVAVRFLRSSTAADSTPRERARTARDIMWRILLGRLPSSIEFRQLRGVGHIVALAHFMLENDPTCIDDGYTREVLDFLGLRHLYVPRARLRSDGDGPLSDAVSGALRNLSMHY